MATMRKTLEWPTTSMTASPKLFLTGTVSLDVEDNWLRSEQMQHRWSGSADCREWDHIPMYTPTEKTDANVIQGRGSKLQQR